ncbi:MAG: DUF1810 family protein [Sphingobacteriia bacterium]|nr:DUF1810 family protein [Sphingobacteriia bacterium]
MTTDDPYDLNRFILAQANDYAPALAEIRSGRKRTHSEDPRGRVSHCTSGDTRPPLEQAFSSIPA